MHQLIVYTSRVTLIQCVVLSLETRARHDKDVWKTTRVNEFRGGWVGKGAGSGFVPPLVS